MELTPGVHRPMGTAWQVMREKKDGRSRIEQRNIAVAGLGPHSPSGAAMHEAASAYLRAPRGRTEDFGRQVCSQPGIPASGYLDVRIVNAMYEFVIFV